MPGSDLSLAATPVIGLVGNIFVHTILSRIRHGRNQISCMAFAVALGLIITMVLTLYFLQGKSALDFWSYLFINTAIALALAWCYFVFVNLNLTSLRIRLLYELHDAPKGLTQSQIIARYNAREIVANRLTRLTDGGHLIERDGRFYVGNDFFLALFVVFELMKYIVLGHGNQLLRQAGCDPGPAGVTPLIKLVWRQKLLRFLLVGMLNTLFSYLFYSGLILLGVDYRIALTILMLAALFFNFLTYGHLVFENRKKRLIFKFLAVYLLVYLVNEACLIFVVCCGFGPILAQGVLLPLIVTISFVLNNYWVFQNQTAIHSDATDD